MEKHFGLIGYPVAHSLSPQMHHAGYKAMGIEAVYQRFTVKPANLEAAVYGLRALDFLGWNVTVPHKEAILPFLDELTPEARKAGAVNTVKVAAGRLIGHNTDGLGFLQSIKKQMPEVSRRQVVILGAGGAAKGIALTLAEQGANILILNRTPEKARKLVESLRTHGVDADWGELTPGSWLREADLIIQTTSVGLHGETMPFSLQGIDKKAFVVDIIFNPSETPFLCEARLQGCKTMNGLGMLLYQGVLAWEFWLGGRAPVEAMAAALSENFSERQ